MRYLVRARVKPGQEDRLLHAIEEETLGRGSVPKANTCAIWATRGSAPIRPCAGSKFAIVRPRCRRSGLTGKNISISQKGRMRTTGASAAMKTVPRRGLAITAIARRDWNGN